MIEHRTFKRLEIPLPLKMRLLGTGHYVPIKALTKNVSLEGLLIEAQVFLEDGSLLIWKGEESVKLDPFLVLDEKLIELDIWLPPKSEKIRATGRVIWYDLGSKGTSYYFRVGVSLEKMGVLDGKRWVNFVKNIVEAEG
ncbi:MAG: hypothetical protein DRG50_07035 [Deltaproteobacteria bacterium]|nr:MAG: hypothetical protein DRG50_07035 [Deltaproteobacteria bacterium]